MFLQFKQTTINLILLKGYSCGGGGLLVEKLTSLNLKNPLLFLSSFGKFFLIILSYQILLGKQFFCNLHFRIIDKH
ncbi:hypothetical protein [Helicobacter sp. UBA3407]|uniref:Uncharacterized protein n=1 Tax=Helicobacter ganmani TaxID=60246 RepID=A0A3D8IH06_9HELI|nr:hypothetical protein [Helicobacter sp. UBA3407]RDU63841.1 hypothetical protein CQA43_03210 [Helicobacter ganmani]